MRAVTVGGPPGSGTSTVCRLLSERTGLEYIYAGQIFRDKARELGLSLADFGALCEREPRYDIELDEEMMGKASKGNVIVEGRMIGPLCMKRDIPSLRIYIDADPSVRAGRVMERDGGDLGEVIGQMEEREKSEISRYLGYYGIDPSDHRWYDLVIDSTYASPEQELDMILEALER